MRGKKKKQDRGKMAVLSGGEQAWGDTSDGDNDLEVDYQEVRYKRKKESSNLRSNVDRVREEREIKVLSHFRENKQIKLCILLSYQK